MLAVADLVNLLAYELARCVVGVLPARLALRAFSGDSDEFLYAD